MYRLTVALLLVAVAAPAAEGQPWARKMFAETSHDFGTVARGAEAVFAFPFQNLYEEEVVVSGVRSSCGCAIPILQDDRREYATWERGAVLARLNTRSFIGHRTATITVSISRPFPAEVQLEVSGFIRSDVVFEPGSVEFGSVPQGQPAERSVAVTYAGRNDWSIRDVRSANPHLEVELHEASRGGGQIGYRMLVRLSGDAPVGYLQDQLVIVTSDARLQQIMLPVEGRVEAALSLSPASLFMGVLRPGQEATRQIVVRAPEPFRITGADAGEGFDVEIGDEAKAMHLVPVTFTAGERGNVNATITLHTDLGGGTSASVVTSATVQ